MITDPLTGSSYSSEWAYVESTERTNPDETSPVRQKVDQFINNTMDYIVEEIKFGLRAEAVKEYSGHYGVYTMYSELNTYIPPDTSFGQPVDAIKGAIDVFVSFAPADELKTPEEYMDIFLPEYKNES